MTQDTTSARDKSYAAFISYSNKADESFAPALQSGMQRLAKHWRQRRSLEVFRDQTGLAVNSDLWDSIRSALDASGWFVLLASPKAASSRWVGMEIEHCVATKTADRILIVLTDGDLEWDSSIADFSASSTAAHPAMRNLFTQPPRIVDMKWAHKENDLTLRHPQFRDQVAEIVAAITAIPKDDLLESDVREQRRTARVVRVAVASLSVVALAAVAASAFAIVNQNTADRERDTAESAAQTAEQQAGIAVEEEGAAVEQARLARSRELAAQSVTLGQEWNQEYFEEVGGAEAPTADPAVAVLLAAQAWAIAPTAEAQGALITVTSSTGVLAGLVEPAYLDEDKGFPWFAQPEVASVSPNGALALRRDGSLVDTASEDVVPFEGDVVTVLSEVAWSSESTHAVYVSPTQTGTSTGGSATYGNLVLLDVTSGQSRTISSQQDICAQQCGAELALSPLGDVVAFRPATNGTGQDAFNPDRTELIVMSLDGANGAGPVQQTLQGPGFLRFSDAGDRLILSDGSLVHSLDPATLDPVQAPVSAASLTRWNFFNDDRALVSTPACGVGVADGSTYAVQATIEVTTSNDEGGPCGRGQDWWAEGGDAVIVQETPSCDLLSENCLVRWPVQGEELVSLVCGSVGRGLTPQEQERFEISTDDPPTCPAGADPKANQNTEADAQADEQVSP